MKKIALLTLLTLTLTLNTSFANAGSKNITENPNFNQKSCQNIFSLINIDFSAFSPRGAATDVVIKEENRMIPPRRPAEMPVANKAVISDEVKEKTTQAKDETSFFRLDLLKLIKIRIL